MASGPPPGPPGSVVAATNKKRKGNGSGRVVPSHHGGAALTGFRQAPVESLNLEEVYGSLISSPATGRRRSPFATTFSYPPHVQGVLNNRNSCFINAVLQALVFTPPFAQLAVSAAAEIELCPTLATLGRWLLSYWARLPTQSIAPPRLPLALHGQATSFSSPVRQGNMDGSVQEDAAEFMQHMLEIIQAELCALERRFRQNAKFGDTADDSHGNKTQTKGWTFVNGRERLSVREQSDERHSILFSAIFGGSVESHLKGKSKTKDHVSVVVEGFFMLQVDVCFGAECSLEVALERTLQMERVHDDAREKDLLKTLKLRRLPIVLLLQVRRWAVTAEGELVKLDNIVHFSKTLVLPKSTCADTTVSNAARTYELVAFVSHRGRATERGHYVAYLTDASSSGNVAPAAVEAVRGGEVLTLCNDARVTTATMQEAVEGEAVYVLVYQHKA
ncbi:ubiquitin hydrolase [Trypanosoma grayi]|uniref:ubiquitin hydrolase n=1 Tax=Trypanosoma grayi TaxID=71804 RepID=UPI0004F4661C|nr:ubiquitin hydrolase [Trypanosoma grayi]KEG07351.1 ubiquitin hydrolase [Trypanosoma grayi]